MVNVRRGLGKGLGTGYKNIAPMDSHIHSLSAKGVKTLSVRYKTLIDFNRYIQEQEDNEIYVPKPVKKYVKDALEKEDFFEKNLNAKGNYGDAFNMSNVEKSVLDIKTGIHAPYVNVQYSTLGGKDRVSILITLSRDKRDDWVNGYIENSRYMRFHFSNDGTLEHFSGDSGFSKNFRKTNVKSPQEAIEKINKYLSQG